MLEAEFESFAESFETDNYYSSTFPNFSVDNAGQAANEDELMNELISLKETLQNLLIFAPSIIISFKQKKCFFNGCITSHYHCN